MVVQYCIEDRTVGHIVPTQRQTLSHDDTWKHAHLGTRIKSKLQSPIQDKELLRIIPMQPQPARALLGKRGTREGN